MNPFDAVGTARISSAVYDRTCRLLIDYQSAADEVADRGPAVGEAAADPAWIAKIVDVVRRTRVHPELRIGSSVRGRSTPRRCRVARHAARHDDGRPHHRSRLRPRRPVGPGAAAGGQRAHRRGDRARVVGRRCSAKGPEHDPGRTERPVIDGGAGLIKRGDEAEAAVNEASRRTSSRRELSRHQQFEQVSPEVGHLDERAFDDALATDEDEAMSLLADLTGATDPVLRDLARRLAGRVVVDVARRGSARRRGSGAWLAVRCSSTTATSTSTPASNRSPRRAPWVACRRWPTCGCGRGSGPTRRCAWWSTGRARWAADDCATAAVAAATVAWRTPSDYSVLAFAADVLVLKEQLAMTAAESVADRLFRLRGSARPTLPWRCAPPGNSWTMSRAARRITVLLSDCRPTAAGDMVEAARALDELVIVAPDDDRDEADASAERSGRSWAA